MQGLRLPAAVRRAPVPSISSIMMSVCPSDDVAVHWSPAMHYCHPVFPPGNVLWSTRWHGKKKMMVSILDVSKQTWAYPSDKFTDVPRVVFRTPGGGSNGHNAPHLGHRRCRHCQLTRVFMYLSYRLEARRFSAPTRSCCKRRSASVPNSRLAARLCAPAALCRDPMRLHWPQSVTRAHCSSDRHLRACPACDTTLF